MSGVPPKSLEALAAARALGPPSRRATPPGAAAATAKKHGISQQMLAKARRVIEAATPDQITAIEQGEATISTIYEIVTGKHPTGIYRDSERQEERSRTITMRATLSRDLRTALKALTSMPDPKEVVKINRVYDRHGVVDETLLPALDWLKGFADAWTAPDDGKDHVDAGVGDDAPGTQQAEPAAPPAPR